MSKQYRITSVDNLLKPFESEIAKRVEHTERVRRALLASAASLTDFANGYLYFGIHREAGGWVYREWAPGARQMRFFGDFNGWNRESHPMTRLKNGVWEIRLTGENALEHGQRVLVEVEREDRRFDRVPAYARWVTQNPESMQYDARVYAPPQPYLWRDEARPKRMPETLLIYECHIGMAQEAGKVGSYDEFTEHTLPRIKRAGYNCIQLMAVMEHAYYASFGYQVTSFFAPSSRYGEPDGLKRLVDRAHEMGLRVLLDLVHAHASSNTRDGIADFDGSGHQYMAGDHPAWGSKLFDYGRMDVVHFLLSNVKYWLEEFHFDGFRFDGVTSMLYYDHGINRRFMGYEQYYGANANLDAAAYLTLATELIHELNPGATAIAEDMSGLPGLCLPVSWGGLGFNFRLNMGVPDFWIRLIKTQRDEEWNMGQLYFELTTRRPYEKRVAYAESHDQALVGDQTLMFRLMGAEMYEGMSKDYTSVTADRAMALHKMIRFITLALAGNAYLTFMGNEFGHPEWVDFPREGNDWSYHYARRQWSLADNDKLKYAWLAAFDRDMLSFAKKAKLLRVKAQRALIVDYARQLIAFEKGECVLAFNFHPTNSIESLEIPDLDCLALESVFSTDDEAYGGSNRIAQDARYPVIDHVCRVYLPARTAAAFVCVSEERAEASRPENAFL